jgi:hypothetical protein
MMHTSIVNDNAKGHLNSPSASLTDDDDDDDDDELGLSIFTVTTDAAREAVPKSIWQKENGIVVSPRALQFCPPS